jgi:IS5 family transposase
VGQLGFFDLSRRYAELDAKNDPLVLIATLVAWEAFRPKLKAALIKGELRSTTRNAGVRRGASHGMKW